MSISDGDPWLAGLRGTPAARCAMLGELYALYGGRIRAYALRHQLGYEQAEDVVQIVFERMMQGHASFRADSLVTSWMWGISRMVVHEQRRQLHSQPESLHHDPDTDDDDDTHPGNHNGRDELSHWPQMEDQICMQKALEEFATKHVERALVLGFVVDGWSIGDIAAYLGRSEGATRQYLSECRKKLSPFIKPCLDCNDQAVLGSRRKERT